MRFQAAATQVRKKKTQASTTKSAIRKLANRSQNTKGISENIHNEVEAQGVKSNKERARKNPTKSMQSQTHHRTKGTLQSPRQSEIRRQKNLQ